MADVFKGLDPDWYSTTVNRTIFTAREARAEYARLRKVANSRIERLEKAGYSDSSIIRRYGDGYESLRGANENTVRKALGDVAHFLGMKTSTVQGQRAALRNYIETMHEHGYDFINKDNAEQFRRFMAAARSHYGKGFDSENTITLYQKSLENEIAPEVVQENFDYWQLNMDFLEIPKASPTDIEEDFGTMEPTKREKRAQSNRRERQRRTKQKGRARQRRR